MRITVANYIKFITSLNTKIRKMTNLQNDRNYENGLDVRIMDIARGNQSWQLAQRPKNSSSCSRSEKPLS